MVTSVSFFPSLSARQVAAEPVITLKNRYAEQNPRLNDTPVSLISRPRLKKFTEVGSGHIRKVFSTPGVFADELFVVSGTDLYRGGYDGAFDLIGTISTSITGDVSMCAVAPIGTTPAFLYIAEGGVLWVYTENGQASGHLDITGTIANNDTVEIDGVYYKWVSTSVDAGTPAGTVGSPWLVAKGTNNGEAMTNLYNAINLTGVAGTDYSTGTVQHTSMFAGSVSATDLYVYAIEFGISGNGKSLTETSANAAWTAATTAGGGADQIRQVMVPDDSGAISVAQINSYVIVVPTQTEEINGRFFWINPGETKIDPTDFATAERSPDGINQVVVFGEMFWLMGQNTTEPWITTGDLTAPVERFKGVLYDRGAWAGTAVQIKDRLVTIDEDGGVWMIAGGAQRVSSPDIEEKIRRAIHKAALLT
jgi:hypothetical protein